MIATTFEKTRIHFNGGVFAAVAVVVADKASRVWPFSLVYRVFNPPLHPQKIPSHQVQSNARSVSTTPSGLLPTYGTFETRDFARPSDPNAKIKHAITGEKNSRHPLYYYGALATTTTTTTKTSLENVTSRNFYYYTIIPIRSTCTRWAKYPGTKFMGTAFK